MYHIAVNGIKPRVYFTLIIKVVIGTRGLLLPVFGGIQLVNSWPVIGWISSKGNIEMLHHKTDCQFGTSLVDSFM